MMCMDAAIPDIQRGVCEFVNAHQFKTHACADDINNSINGADLVKVDFLDGHVMDASFGFAQSLEYLAGASRDAGWQPGLADQSEDGIQ